MLFGILGKKWNVVDAQDYTGRLSVMVTGDAEVGRFGCMQVCRGVLADVFEQVITVTRNGEDFIKVIIKRLFRDVKCTESCSFAVFLTLRQ